MLNMKCIPIQSCKNSSWLIVFFLFLLASGFAQSWESLSVESPEPIQDVYALSQDSLFAVSGNTSTARIYSSIDAGITWSEIQRSDLGLQYAIAKTPLGNLLSCGYGGKGLRSTDAGTTWQAVSFGRSDWIMDWCALPNGRLLAVGLNGRCFFSDDDGINWQSPQPITNSWLLAVTTDNQGVAWAVGSDGVILNSSDGVSWNLVVQDSPNTLTDITLTPTNELLACGFNGELLQSADSGASWQVQRSGSEEWNAILIREGQYWLLGTGGIKSAQDSLMLPAPFSFSTLSSGTLLPDGSILAGAKNGRLFICRFPIQSIVEPTLNITLFPNPSQGGFYLKDANPGTYLLSDTQGRIQAAWTVLNSDSFLPLPAHLPSGSYILRKNQSNLHQILMVKK
jgi:photosystem II stability/assembly factor-like uncharacterized protein